MVSFSVIRSEDRWPGLGLGQVLAAALFCGLLFAWPQGYWGFAVAICALAAAGLAWALSARRIGFDWRYIPVALIGVWAVAQLFAGSTIEAALTKRAAVVWGASAVAFVLGSQVLRERRVRDRFLKVLLGGSVALAGFAAIQKFAFPGEVFGLFPAASSVVGTFFYENQFAGFLEIAAPIALWRILRGDAVYGGGCYAILFGAAVVSGSRAGVVLVASELVIFLFVATAVRHFPAKASIAVAGLILVLATAAALVVGTDQIWQKLDSRVPETVRAELTRSTWEMVKTRPWFGYGMGAWRPVYPQFARFDLGLIANEAHDDWAQWAAEGGIPFALLMALLAASLLKPAARSIWGLGFPIVLVHSSVDYVLREPALAFLWFAIGGALSQGGRET
jgi:hypothetical protein